jgi:histidinol-phosphate aminotransferase
MVAAAPELTAILKACQAPYPISKPSAEVAIQAFDSVNRQHTHATVQLCLSERRRVAEALQSIPVVLKVFDSDANFVLAKFSETDAVHRYLLERGIVVRAMSQYPAIADCLRISIGTPAENNTLLDALAQYSVKSHA